MYDVRHFLSAGSLLAVFIGFGCGEPDPGRPSPRPDPAIEAGPLADGESVEVAETVTGRVDAVLDAGAYTYFLLHVGEHDDRWVVVAGDEHRRAERLTVEVFARRQDFVSRRLGRRFTELDFGSVAFSSSGDQ